ncbi:MAG: LamG-like jellyroll fold domain-containing protein [Planctomycetota bacterium]
MTHDDPKMAELGVLVAAMVEGALSATQRDRLVELLREDREAKRFYQRYLELHAMLEWEAGAAASQSEPADALDDLLRMERSAEPINPLVAGLGMQPAKTTHPVTVTRNEMLAAGSYLLRHTLTPKVIASLATAAALLLGVVITVVLLSGPGEVEPVAERPGSTPTAPTADAYRVVATVTGQVNAQWVSANGQGALPDRMLLGVNQRLTLTQGFAEITTNRGAKVLIQAPATIETTDSDNAVRLHRGKLVGICKTPSSKGFTVHAPGLDVIDLGTVFGVSADADNGSTVTVMEGSVRAEPTEISPLAFEPVVLERDQARRVKPETGGLETVVKSELPVFYEQAPHPYVSAVLDAAPVAYWRFEDDQARTVVNEIDPGTDDLAVVGPATLTRSGVIGRAGLLTNRAEPYGYFETANPIDQLAGFEEGTIEFWYYADVRLKQQEGYDAAMMLSLHDATAKLSEPGATSKELIALELTDDAWLFDQERTKPVGWLEYSMRVYPGFFVDGGGQRDIYLDHAHPVQRWQYVALVKQDDVITVYLDGRRVEEMPHAFGPISPASVRIGRTFDFAFEDREKDPGFKTPPRPFMGRMDEVAIYDKPLTAAQIARHYDLATGQHSP